MTKVGELGGGSRGTLPQVVTPRAPAVSVPAFHPGEVASVDPRRMFSILRRRMRLFAGVALAILAVDAAYTVLAPRQYHTAAEIMLNRRNAKVTNSDDVLSALPTDSAEVDTEVEILKSPQLARRVMQSLRLDQDPEFNRRPSSRPLTGPQLQKVVAAVRSKLDITRSGLTYVIDVGYKSHDPAKAARIANEFARLFLVQQIETKTNATQHAADWLSERLDQLRIQVTADETAVHQFKAAHHLMSTQGATLTEQELSSYNQNLAQAKAQVAEDEARLNTARTQLATGSSGDDVGEALSSQTIEKLKEQRAEVSRKVATLQTSFQDAYPELKIARNELADIDSEIQAETSRIISNLEARAEVSRRRAAAVAASVGGAEGQLAANDAAGVRLDELERNAQASRQLYESYLARYKETSSQVGLAQADAQLVSTAPVPARPSSPNVPVNAALGLVLALAGGLGAAALAELLESGLATSADVERRFQVRYLGAIPTLGSVAKRARMAPFDYVVEKPLSGFAEACRSLVTAIVHGPTGERVRTVVVTSALPGEGKTTTSICLARAAALQGYRVVVVDCDLRHRSLGQIVPEPRGPGLLEVLTGQAALEQALVKDERTDVDVLPLSHAPTSLKDVFGWPAMDRLLMQLRSRYDLVVLDAAPLVPVADTRVLASKADFVAVVARWRTTPYQAIQGALGLLADSGVEVGGMVLNQVDMEQQVRHGYGDLAYYFSRYRVYYLDSPDHRVAGE